MSDAREASSVAETLEGDANFHASEVERLNRDIEEAEARIVQLRARRINSARIAAESRAAVNVLREVGLRSSIVDGVVNVAMDYQPQRPTLAESGGPE